MSRKDQNRDTTDAGAAETPLPLSPGMRDLISRAISPEAAIRAADISWRLHGKRRRPGQAGGAAETGRNGQPAPPPGPPPQALRALAPPPPPAPLPPCGPAPQVPAEGPPSSSCKPRQRTLDDRRFVDDYLSGQFTYSQLAERHGLSLSMVGKVIRGERRPRVAELIAAMADAASRQAKARLTGLLNKAINVLTAAMDRPGTPASLAAARLIITRGLADPGRDRPARGRGSWREYWSPPPPPQPPRPRRRITLKDVPPDLIDEPGWLPTEPGPYGGRPPPSVQAPPSSQAPCGKCDKFDQRPQSSRAPSGKFDLRPMLDELRLNQPRRSDQPPAPPPSPQTAPPAPRQCGAAADETPERQWPDERPRSSTAGDAQAAEDIREQDDRTRGRSGPDRAACPGADAGPTAARTADRYGGSPARDRPPPPAARHPSALRRHLAA